MLKAKALYHVGLKVTDMDRSLRFYCDGLGLKLLRRKDKGPGIASAVLAVSTQKMNLALARAGIAIAKQPVKRSDGFSLFVTDPDGCRVELIVKD